jgi:hypothetical protein
MKRQASKITLNRESLRQLDRSDLTRAATGVQLSEKIACPGSQSCPDVINCRF